MSGTKSWISADRFEETDPDDPGDPMTPGDYDFVYDNIGNRDTYTLDGGTATEYTANELNQYTATANPSASFSYDEDGNLTDDGSFTFTWDAENRLIAVEPAASPANGDTMMAFAYDYMGRRVRKTVSTYHGGWSESSDLLFVYDGWNPVLVLNADGPTPSPFSSQILPAHRSLPPNRSHRRITAAVSSFPASGEMRHSPR